MHTKISPFPCMQGGTCGTKNCGGRGLMYSAWPIRVCWVAGSGWMPIWLTNADQLRSAHAERGSLVKPTPKCPCHMRVLCEKRVLDLVVETRMQQGILGFVKRNYCFEPRWRQFNVGWRDVRARDFEYKLEMVHWVIVGTSVLHIYIYAFWKISKTYIFFRPK